MLAAIRSAAIVGIDAYDITIEVNVTRGLPLWVIVGLPSGAVKESRDRVSAALANSGIDIPSRRITVSLSPGDTRKEGTAFDLGIAVGVLAATGHVPAAACDGVAFIGELGLDGALRPIRGALSIAHHLGTSAVARRLVLPPANAAEAALVPSLPITTPANLAQLIDWLRSDAMPSATASRSVPASDAAPTVDFSDVVGQESAKRALEISAAGGHACLLVGPPGAGKTMLAKRLPSILPPLTNDESLEVTAIHSVAGLLHPSAVVVDQRPFRAPHHSISSAGLVGGGGVPRPGEVSLAHHGVLFLDELLEFPRNVLEALRQPLEDGRVVIARAAVTVSFPARFSLIAAMNPCPCGYAGEPTRACVCAEAEILRYRARLSGPLADRIDMHTTLASVPIRLLSAGRSGDTSESIRARVIAARERQRARYRRLRAVQCNAHASGRWLVSHGGLDTAARELLTTASDRLHLSARGFNRVLKVARTIADLSRESSVLATHVAEALQYRPRDDQRLPGPQSLSNVS